jgi:hypothetical protein
MRKRAGIGLLLGSNSPWPTRIGRIVWLGNSCSLLVRALLNNLQSPVVLVSSEKKYGFGVAVR